VTRRAWILVVPLVALIAFATRQKMVHKSPVEAKSSVNAVERPTGDRPRLARHDVDMNADVNREDALRALARRSVVFVRLPASDQEWVLTQAMARVQDPSDPVLPSLVDELSEVRLFAVSEREEPMPAPTAAREPPEPSR
jgi:hypothetical protein